MKINFSDINDVKWLFSNNKAITLLQKEKAPLILSFFFEAFKEKNKVAYLSSEITSLLSDFLFNINQQAEQYAGTPKYYLDQWTKDGFLRQYYEARNEEAILELTPATEQALRWITELNKTELKWISITGATSTYKDYRSFHNSGAIIHACEPS